MAAMEEQEVQVVMATLVVTAAQAVTLAVVTVDLMAQV
jgi:hypothetical protein